MALKVVSNTLYSTDPRTGDTISEFSATNPEDIPEIFERAKSAFKTWSDLTLKTRLELFRKAYRQFYLYQDEVAQLISQETGKPLAEAYSSEILPILDCFKYYLKNIPKFLKSHRTGSLNPLFKLRRGLVKYEPLGVIAVISPWNFPFLLAMQHIIPAILAGNAVIHKPSELTSLTGLKILEIFDRAYLPKNILNIVTGLSDVGQALVKSKFDKIMFTGSTEIGKKVYQAAADNLVPVNMELGGSDPMIVLEDANIERAVNATVWGAFSNAGQACLSVERLFVHESILEVFCEKLGEKTRELMAKPDCETDIDLSCLINDRQFEKICSYIEDASDKGATVLFGGKPLKDLGDLYFEPTVLTNVNSHMDVVKNEIFGPVITMMPFITEDEAIFLANDSSFGLSASVWTQDLKRGVKIANQIHAGSVIVNDLQIHIAQMEAPYTGFKTSGIGVSHGPWGVMEVVRPKYINTDRLIARSVLKLFSKDFVNNNIWWYKYSEKLVNDLRVFNDFLHGDSIWRKIKAIPATMKALFRKNYI